MTHLRRYSDALAALVNAEINRQRLGRDISFEVSVAPAQNEHGMFVTYTVMLTMPSPIIGNQLIAITQAIGPTPGKEEVRRMVADAITALDGEMEKQLSIPRQN